jgi:hypothetical protein
MMNFGTGTSRKWSFAAAGVALLFGFALPVPARAVSTPRIEIDNEQRDMGTVPKGEKIDVVFNVKNTGGEDLIISDARPSCGCTVASFDKVIKPGQAGKIEAAIDTQNFQGPIVKSVTVVSNDPTRPQLNLTIKANVKPYVDVSPEPFVRFSVVKGDTAEQDLILSSEEKEFHPTGPESTQPYVSVKLSPASEKERVAGKSGEQYKLAVKVTGDAPEGLLNVPVTVSTGISKAPKIEIPVSGLVRPRLSVTPFSVNFGNFQPGPDPITRNVVFINNKPSDPVKVTGAEVSVSGLSVDVVPIQEGASYTIVLKATDKLSKGAFDGTLKIHTTDARKPVIDVPVHGQVL